MISRKMVAAMLAVAVAVPVSAQEGTLLEEVVVTAQRREQSLQDVPVSITAFTGAMIEQANVTDAADYLKMTPNVAFTEGFSVGKRGIGIAIRGVGNNVTDENTFINSVGVYLDGFSVAAVPTGIVNPQLQDVARIEVLRGPQGTYFGRNSVGGALNLTTEKPKLGEFGWDVNIGGETYENAGGQGDVTGVVNIPLGDTLAARFVAHYEDNTGKVENVNPGGNDSWHEYFMGRLALRWEPNERTRVDFLVMHTDEEQGTDENVPSGVWDLDTVETFGLGFDGTTGFDVATREPCTPGVDCPGTQLDIAGGTITDPGAGGAQCLPADSQAPGSGLPTCPTGFVVPAASGLVEPADANILNSDPIGFWPDNRDETSRDGDEFNDNTSTIMVLNVSYDLTEDIALKSVTGIIGTTNERFFDNDLLGGGNSLAATGLAQGDAITRDNNMQGTSWSQELRIEISKELFDLTAGILYAEDDIDRQNGVKIAEAGQGILAVPNAAPGSGVVFPPAPVIGPPGAPLQATKKVFRTESAALFADGTWHATPKLDLTFGFRYTHDKVVNGLLNPLTGAPGDLVDADFDDFAPRFVARYQMSDNLGLYANISKGYKAGGHSVFNLFALPGAPIESERFPKETLWNFEVGFKSEWFDRRLRLNAAGFFTDWTDMQLESFRFAIPGNLGTNIEQVISVDSAEAFGAEVELAALVTEHFSVTAALGYLDAEITCDCPATIKASSPVQLDGVTTPRSPDITATVSGEYRYPIGPGEAWVRLDYIHVDEQTTDIEGATFEQHRGLAIPSFLGFAPPTPDGFPYVAPSYDVVNLRAGYEFGNWRINGYVENLFDEEYYTSTQEDFGLSGFRLRPNPLTIGGSIGYRFGGI